MNNCTTHYFAENYCANDDYHLKIVVTSDFPEHILSVFDINDDIPNDFNHFLTDGSYSL